MRWLRAWLRREQAGPEDAIARVERLLLMLEQETPSYGRLRQIPIDLIAQAVEGYLADARLEPTDHAIQRALRVIASRNALGPLMAASYA